MPTPSSRASGDRPCPYCNNTRVFTDSNGATWKCHFCRGRRFYRDRDYFDAVQDERAEHRLATGELLPIRDFFPNKEAA